MKFNDFKNDEVSYEEIEEWENKHCDALARYDILMKEIESKLNLFKKMEKQSATEQEERRFEQTMMMEMMRMKK